MNVYKYKKYKNTNFHKIIFKNGSNAIFSKNNYFTGIMYKTFFKRN